MILPKSADVMLSWPTTSFLTTMMIIKLTLLAIFSHCKKKNEEKNTNNMHDDLYMRRANTQIFACIEFGFRISLLFAIK